MQDYSFDDVMKGRGSKDAPLDTLIVGAGMAGLYALYHMRERGLSAVVWEAGDGVGGTWHWNRYPGCRVDIESVEYCYSFSDELQQEWEWTERYAAQPELLRYFNHVADRFDLRPSIALNTRVESAIFDEASGLWKVTSENGDVAFARFCIMATGFLSAPNQPQFKGMEDFEGEQYHTAFWPREGVDFSGKRVAIIGTGSTAVQAIPLLAQQASHLTVFQRTPPFAVPLRNCEMPREYLEKVRAEYPEWRRREREESFGGWVAVNFEYADLVTKSALEVSEEERLALYEDRWKSGGLAMYNIYPDTVADPEANATITSFLQEKIRARVDDPEIAELLTPKGYPALTKRLCCDTNYYETYNRDNVTLVDISQDAIDHISKKGVVVAGKEYEVDAIVFATGFDALSGALLRFDIRGRDGVQLKDHWSDGARTALGLMASGFPNMFLLDGPGSPCPLFQPILLSEDQVRWVGDCISYLDGEGRSTIEPTSGFEDDWLDLCSTALNATLFPQANSWYVGANIEGKGPVGLAYFGGINNYWDHCRTSADNGYAGFTLGTKTASAMAK
ncbi:flavin-containing monooxygenase [Croceicoccus sediminis]|uniref:flavin-containing monooxygenase n=1 Tax=Croceicoccus sediminis TaxID=2571150 RepID=UPI00147925D0|nr:NAD(P)/FAD-dependent oxidoreductase [Croceicoccus sediminis]